MDKNPNITMKKFRKLSFLFSYFYIAMSLPEDEIKEIVNRETTAWNTLDAELLMSIFHQDMVWPWPPDNSSHDPMNWILELGRFNYKRWKQSFQKLFDSHKLIHNRREIKKIEISKEEDGAFAVVDIDTLWIQNTTNKKDQWKGRVCKVYTKVENEWKLIMHTGVLSY